MTAKQTKHRSDIRQKASRKLVLEEEFLTHPLFGELGAGGFLIAFSVHHLRNRFGAWGEEEVKTIEQILDNLGKAEFFATYDLIAEIPPTSPVTARRYVDLFDRLGLLHRRRGSPANEYVLPRWTRDLLDRAYAVWQALPETPPAQGGDSREARARRKDARLKQECRRRGELFTSEHRERSLVNTSPVHGEHTDRSRVNRPSVHGEHPSSTGPSSGNPVLETLSRPERDSNLSLSSVKDIAEACRKARGWSWSAKDRRREEETATRFMADGYTADEIRGCLSDAPEAKSLSYLGPRLASWKAGRSLPPGTAPCWKCDVLVVMQRGDRLRGVQVGDRWQHLSCPGTVLVCLACGRPVDPVVSARKMEENKQEFEATTAIAGYELGRLPDGRMAVTHAGGGCEESAWAAYDEAKEKASSP